MKGLKELRNGQGAIISDANEDMHLLSRVASVGLTIGRRAEMLRNEKRILLPLYGRGTVIALNRNESVNILMEVAA